MVLLFTDGAPGYSPGANAEQKVVFLKSPDAPAAAGPGRGRRAAAMRRSGRARRCCCAPRAAIAADAPFNLRWLPASSAGTPRAARYGTCLADPQLSDDLPADLV